MKITLLKGFKKLFKKDRSNVIKKKIDSLVDEYNSNPGIRFSQSDMLMAFKYYEALEKFEDGNVITPREYKLIKHIYMSFVLSSIPEYVIEAHNYLFILIRKASDMVCEEYSYDDRVLNIKEKWEDEVFKKYSKAIDINIVTLLDTLIDEFTLYINKNVDEKPKRVKKRKTP